MIELSLASPFWADPATLDVDGEDEEAVTRIILAALVTAGYDIQVRADDGTFIPLDEYDWGEA